MYIYWGTPLSIHKGRPGSWKRLRKFFGQLGAAGVTNAPIQGQPCAVGPYKKPIHGQLEIVWPSKTPIQSQVGVIWPFKKPIQGQLGAVRPFKVLRQSERNVQLSFSDPKLLQQLLQQNWRACTRRRRWISRYRREHSSGWKFSSMNGPKSSGFQVLAGPTI